MIRPTNEAEARREFIRRKCTILGEFHNTHGELFIVFKKATGNYFVTGSEFDWLLNFRVSYLSLKDHTRLASVYQGKAHFYLEKSESEEIAKIVIRDLN